MPRRSRVRAERAPAPRRAAAPNRPAPERAAAPNTPAPERVGEVHELRRADALLGLQSCSRQCVDIMLIGEPLWRDVAPCRAQRRPHEVRGRRCQRHLCTATPTPAASPMTTRNVPIAAMTQSRRLLSMTYKKGSERGTAVTVARRVRGWFVAGLRRARRSALPVRNIPPEKTRYRFFFSPSKSY